MTLISFTENHQDLSTDRGYQFKFLCDHCQNGFLTGFQTSVTGTAGGLLRAAGSMFGGVFGSAAQGAFEVQRVVGGKAHDDAFRTAVEEAKGHFKQCTRCGKWVCPENCWNARRGLCKQCAPDLEEERAAAQAQATKDQIWQKASATDYAGKVDMVSEAAVLCPHCGARTEGGKFCPACGGQVQVRIKCPQCGAEAQEGTKFCPECGGKMQAGPPKCPQCGVEAQPGVKFCPDCGAKIQK